MAPKGEANDSEAMEPDPGTGSADKTQGVNTLDTSNGAARHRAFLHRMVA